MTRGNLLVLMVFLVMTSGYSQDTFIKGGRMELLEKGEKVIFKDGVAMQRGADTLKALEMTTNKNRDKISASGNVQLFRRLSSTETFQATGDRGRYDTTTGIGNLESKKGQTHLIHTTVISTSSVRVVNLYADQVEFSNVQQKATAQGNVRGDTIDPDTYDFYKFWSQKAEWDGTEHKIILTGLPLPVVRQESKDETKIITGERVTYFMDRKKFLSEGRAKAILSDKKGRGLP